jgi:hypothetical protein
MLNKLQITKQLTSSLRNSVISVPRFIMNYSFSEVEKTSDERVTLLKNVRNVLHWATFPHFPLPRIRTMRKMKVMIMKLIPDNNHLDP